MSQTPLFCYCDFGGNIGDRICSPKCFIRDWNKAESVYPPRNGNWCNSDAPIILGGGGLFHAGSDDMYDRILDSGRKVIVWGAGTNLRGFGEPWFGPKALSRCALVGVRDYGTPFDWMPCASCLNPGFSKTAIPKEKLCVYSHYDMPIPIDGPIKLTNDQASVEPVIRAFLSAQTVITNSYHGAYWAMLLGRQALMYRPAHNKLNFFKYKPKACDEADYLPKCTGEPTAPPYFLEECRELNKGYFAKVKTILQ